MKFQEQGAESGTLSAPGFRAGYSRRESGIVWYVLRAGFPGARGMAPSAEEAQKMILRNLLGGEDFNGAYKKGAGVIPCPHEKRRR